MSQPEWMQKFQEIGQKGEEEVTEIGETGFVTRTEQRRSMDDLEEMAERTSVMAEDTEEVDNPALLFRNAGSTTTSVMAEDTEEVDDPALLFRNAGSRDPESTTTPSDMTSEAANMTRSSRSEDPPEDVSLNAVTSAGSSAADQEENLGESWVVDRRGGQNKAAVGMSQSTFGESFITEEILVDEDGNEIFLDEDGDEIREEEVLVDEDGNNILPTQDLENVDYQQAAPPVTRSSSYYARQPAYTRKSQALYDIEDQKRILGVGKGGKRSRMSWLIPVLLCGLVVAAVVLVLFFVVFDNDSSSPPSAPNPPLGPETSSANSIDAAATTAFDPVQNNCDFKGLEQPNVLDQCACNGSVNVIADDVRSRYKGLRKSFIPSIYPEWSYSINSCEPENQALLWLSSGINNGGEISDIIRLQRYILGVVYYAQGGPGWQRSSNWLSEQDACAWEGVQCDKFGYIYVLDLANNGMTGELSDAPTRLNAIEGYWIANNHLEGSIPEAYFRSTTLTFIDFSNNELSGEFSGNIAKKSQLDHINLSSNKLTGTLPNRIKRISTLTRLNIESNHFTGTVPPNLLSLNLTELAIGGNNFQGTIPTELSTVSTLTSLSLGPNFFTGDIPVDLSNLTGLVELSMTGIPDLSGRLPANYGLSLTNLVNLDISNTNVEGDIPGQFSLLSKLTSLRLSNNNLRGNIPEGFNLLESIESLHLDGNVLTGMIPPTLAALSGLKELELHSNMLTGTIPVEFQQLLKMKSLTLNGNLVSGRAPEGVCSLREGELSKFIVDCPMRVNEFDVQGIICTIPTCCTECIGQS